MPVGMRPPDFEFNIDFSHTQGAGGSGLQSNPEMTHAVIAPASLDPAQSCIEVGQLAAHGDERLVAPSSNTLS